MLPVYSVTHVPGCSGERTPDRRLFVIDAELPTCEAPSGVGSNKDVAIDTSVHELRR